ncbi:vWA domain-containing protein [Chryseobacterium populi]|uniref:von Willebrand factor type A (VWA) domain protein containing protein n=1 Tax=Chryseobacterium populi TaxID=1144316 RepID=J3CHK1_9FLAO|nr:VWA domain-containing protein [Chryseobacterium populi]EJL71526.1 von Willebrand factor type A (vWA) domain protein containing protein [Chryseobacterium populi]
MENNHDIDKKFNEASKILEEPATFPAFEKVWEKIEEKLDKKEDKKRIIPVWFPYGIAASLIIGLGAFYFLNKKEVAGPAKPVITKNMVSPKINSNSKIEKINRTVKSNIEKEIQAVKPIEEPTVIAYQDVKANRKKPVDIYKKQNMGVPVALPVPKTVYDTFKEHMLEEVALLGYSNKKVQAYTSSSVSVRTENIAPGYSTQSLQGKVAGVQITSKRDKRKNNQIAGNSGNPGVPQELIERAFGLQAGKLNNSDSRIVIRGNKSISETNTALVVINGVVSNTSVLQQLPPEIIGGIRVIKGQEATALYGAQASNGVIVVTTRKLSGKEKRKLKRLQKNLVTNQQTISYNDEEYDAFVENPFELTKNQPLSTFSIDVDNASYSNVRRMINNGEKVDKNAVRIEEMINYFKYDYPQPQNNQPFSINTEYNDAPWNPDHKLLKIGLQGKNIPMDKLPNSNFVFLIDVSGSMDEANKLPLLKSSFKVLLDKLRPEDKVGIVVYAGNAGMVLSPTSAKEKEKIMQALDNLQAGGSTAGGAGIELAYKLAQENFIKNGNNRVIIATDGDFNVGVSSVSNLESLIEEKRKSGVFLTCLGFGMGNFKDNRLETLADKGNGNYAYIDNMQEANKFLGKEFAGNMYAIAKDVKIQIEFNPKLVKSYRLIGYENRKLRNEDFTNDKIDAGELGSGHTVTALYEVIPAHVNSAILPKENDLKYSKTSSSQSFGDELATIKFRYKKPDGDQSTEITEVVKNSNESFVQSSPDFRFASSVAWFGLVLRESKLIEKKDLNSIEDLAKKGKNKDEEGYRSEFIRLVESYKAIKK